MATIKIKVSPGAKRNEIAGIMADGSLRVRVKARRERGEANRELINFLSSVLKVEKRKIKILRGLTSTTKLVEIEGIEREKIEDLLR